MKTLARFPRLSILLVVLLFLSACERSLNPDSPTATPGVVVTVPLFVTPTTELVIPPTVESYPVPTVPVGEGIPTTQAPTEGTAVPTPESPVPTLPSPGVPTVHTVQAGETLGQIAQLYGVSVNDIAVANNLADVNTLDVGQQLTIPVAGSGDGSQPQTGQQEYIVQAGDTLYRIGLAYGFTVEELTSYNGLADPNDLEVGQVIRIPPEG